MNVIETKPAALYPAEAGLIHNTFAAPTVVRAYLVLGRVGEDALVIEGEGVEDAAAIEHLVRKIKIVRDFIDVSLHGAFWRFYEEQQEKKRGEMKEMLRGLGLVGPEMPIAKKKDDEGMS